MGFTLKPTASLIPYFEEGINPASNSIERFCSSPQQLLLALIICNNLKIIEEIIPGWNLAEKNIWKAEVSDFSSFRPLLGRKVLV